MSIERRLAHDDIRNIHADAHTPPTDIGHMPWRSVIFISSSASLRVGQSIFDLCCLQTACSSCKMAVLTSEPLAFCLLKDGCSQQAPAELTQTRSIQRGLILHPTSTDRGGLHAFKGPWPLCSAADTSVHRLVVYQSTTPCDIYEAWGLYLSRGLPALAPPKN